MKVQIYGKNITVTPAIAEKIEKKLNMLNKYFIIAEDDTANVVVRVYPAKQKIEVTIPTKYAVLRAEVVHDDLYAAIDLAVDKLEDQIRRQKTRLTRKNKTKLAEAFVDHELLGEEYDESEDEVVRTKTIDPDMMDLDEAIMRMEMLGHSFFIYRDDETREIAVVYKRNDGELKNPTKTPTNAITTKISMVTTGENSLLSHQPPAEDNKCGCQASRIYRI